MRLIAMVLLLASAAFGQEPRAIETVLSEQTDGRVAWILVAADGRRWERGFDDERILPGSLLKPFAALAWLESHAGAALTTDCRGDGCWLPTGHGRVGLTEALAQSCNHYFAQLAQQLRHEQIAAVALHYGLAPPPADLPEAWWGWGDGWPVEASPLLSAFQELVRRRQAPSNAHVLAGLRLAAESGTARGAGESLAAPALAKTGTAPCRHPQRSAADGLAILVYPAVSPRYTMLLQACGRTGRQTATAAGLALAKLTETRFPSRP